MYNKIAQFKGDGRFKAGYVFWAAILFDFDQKFDIFP